MKPTGTQAVVNRVEELRRCTDSKIHGLQASRVPTFGNISLHKKFYYRFNGEEYYIRDTSYQCYLAHNLPYMQATDSKKHYIFKDTLISCINKRIIHPFLLFVQGKFIPWTNIIIIRDYYYSYLLISDYDDFGVFDDYDSIFLPCFVKYGENSLLYNATDTTPFLFNKDRYLTMSTSELKGRVEIIDPTISGSDYTITKNNPYFIVETDKIPINKDNIIIFKNGIPYPDGLQYIEDKGANTFVFNTDEEDFDYSSLLFKVFYSTNGNRSKNHVYNDSVDIDSVRSDIVGEIKYEENHPYLSFIRSGFDFRHDVHLSYDINVSNSISYILGYNPGLFNDVYLQMSNVKSVSYTGSEVLDMIKDNHLTMYRRNRDNNTDTFVMIFQNNKLFSCYHRIDFIENKFDVVVDPDVISDSDVFEFIFFEESNNEAVDLIINEGESNYISELYNLEDCDLYSTEVEDPEFNLYSEKDHLQYKVPFSWTQENGNTYKITLDNPWYYGKTLHLSSRKQFRHCWNNITSDRLTITLSPDFKYCHDLSHYMVFVNGIKLDPDQLSRLSIPDATLPFDELCLYTNVPLRVGDVVDVLYIPNTTKIKQVTGNALLETGYVTLNFGEDFYNFSKDLQFVFINGMKIHPDYIQDIGGNTIRILNQNDAEITSIEIIDYIDPIDMLSEIVIETPELWKSLIDSLTEEEFYNVIKNLPEINVTYDLRSTMVADKAVVYEIIHNFYQVDGIIRNDNGEVNYQYTTEVLDGGDYDDAGNYIIRSMDATIEDKADIYNTTEDEEDDNPSYNNEERSEVSYG